MYLMVSSDEPSKVFLMPSESADEPQAHIAYVPFTKPVPTRRVVLAWRRSFTRYEAIAALRNAIYACELKGVKRLTG